MSYQCINVRTIICGSPGWSFFLSNTRFFFCTQFYLDLCCDSPQKSQDKAVEHHPGGVRGCSLFACTEINHHNDWHVGGWGCLGDWETQNASHSLTNKEAAFPSLCLGFVFFFFSCSIFFILHLRLHLSCCICACFIVCHFEVPSDPNPYFIILGLKLI